MSVPTTDPADYVAPARRILERCDQLAAVSARPGSIERLYLTPEHARANRLTADWMVEAAMTTWRDAAGNQCGRIEGSTPGLPALVIGSHLDTVPDAGRYDGILGVMLAIETVGRLARQPGLTRGLPFAAEVVAFADEEGARFGATLLGSRALAGTWDARWWDVTDDDGVSMRDAFAGFGLDPADIGSAARRHENVVGYLEAHIEQGPYLEAADRALGVVTSIAGARRFACTLSGEARHAGGTPYERRHDALCGASEAVLAVERLARASDCIGTVGHLRVEPDAVNVIPGSVEFSVDLRAEHDADRDSTWTRLETALAEICARRGLAYHAHELHRADAMSWSPALMAAVDAGIAVTGDNDPPYLFSKAGHDAMAMADLTDVGMLFLRCADGISHHPAEAVRADDVAVALMAMEATVLGLARQHADTSSRI